MFVVPLCISNFSVVLIVLCVITRSAIDQNLSQTFLMSIYKILRNNLFCSYYLCWSARTQFRISESDLCTELRVIFPKYLDFCCSCCFLASDPVITFNCGNLSTSFKQSEDNGSWYTPPVFEELDVYVHRSMMSGTSRRVSTWPRRCRYIIYVNGIGKKLYKIWFWLVVYRSMALSNLDKLLF
jgi:hypothetical protein